LQLRKKSNKAKVEYGDLGTGLRRLLFERAQVWALCFDREINHGFAFLEEPESQLHPDWAQRILPMYLESLPDSQIFLSTHSPLVAAQFDPAERLILSLDEKGNPQLRRSTCAPEASLPEILNSDFN
jgi:predicted ATPase